MPGHTLIRDNATGEIFTSDGIRVYDVPDPSGEPDGEWLMTSGGAAVWSPAPGVTSVDAITGDVTLVAGSNVTIVDNDPSPGSILISAAAGGTGSPEIGYEEITAGVNITGTTSATATTVLSPGALAFNGSPVLVSVFCPEISCDTNAIGDFFRVSLFEGSTELGVIGLARNLLTGGTHVAQSLFGQYRFAPSSGSHTYTVRCYVTSTTGTPSFAAGAGGTNGLLPAFVRFEYA